MDALTLAKQCFLRQKQPWRSVFRHPYSSASQPVFMGRLISEPIEEELLPVHRLRCFHPTKPNEILDGRFKTIAKLGFGAGSTVWLAENLKFKERSNSPSLRFVSIKIAALDTYSSREMTCWKLIATSNPSHEGIAFIRTPVDKFELKGLDGTHLCLVYEPMRETLFQFQQRVRRERLAPPLFKLFIYCLLEALNYLHTDCKIIHTDIKDDNIMVTIENDAILTDFVNSQRENPHSMHIRTEDGRLADFNLSFPGLDQSLGHLSAIQSHRFRAPEVLLGCPWSYSVDIWSVGLLMWNLLENISLFDRPSGEDGEYDAHVHLAQMVSIFGEPPHELIKKERLFREHRLDRPIMNSRGESFSCMNQFWGGPFFNDNGKSHTRDTKSH
ncbi:kinase domain protein [Trichoderma chlorosporum]